MSGQNLFHQYDLVAARINDAKNMKTTTTSEYVADVTRLHARQFLTEYVG